jgi:hypothetical protein
MTQLVLILAEVEARQWEWFQHRLQLTAAVVAVDMGLLVEVELQHHYLLKTV